MIDKNHIRNLLTLRYDPDSKSEFIQREISDFKPIKRENQEKKIVEIIKEDLIEKQEKYNFKEISMSLSGGIDSGLSLALIRDTFPDVKINCIGVGFGDIDDETHRAKELAQIYDCNFIEIIKEDLLSDLPKLINLTKEPKWNLYNYYTFEKGKEFSDVFFTGDGGDEIFGGYTFRLQKILDTTYDGMTWKDKVKLYLNCHERDWVPDQEELFSKEMNFSWDLIYEKFKRYFDNDLSIIDQVFLADFNGKLIHDWIPSNKKFEKDLNLSINSIFLNPKLIEFATHIPWKQKYDSKTNFGKIPLRNIIQNYRGFKDEKLVKKGFGSNLFNLWDNSKELIFNYVNKDAEIIKNKIINKKWLDRTFKKIQESETVDLRYASKIISLFSFEIWYKLFVTKSLKVNQKI
jgi:asparagine synthase (glutamine-hydrolysing)